MGICDVWNSHGHFSIYSNALCYCSVHWGHILLPAFPNHQFTRCSACSDRSGVCLCLLQPYGYCSGVNDVPHVQDLKISREILYAVITTSCVKASQQQIIWSCWIGFDRGNHSLTSIGSHYWLLVRRFVIRI